jgi:hypothetical protein
MIYEIIVVADYNDGDYVTEISTIEQADLDKLMPLFKALKDNHGKFDSYVPRAWDKETKREDHVVAGGLYARDWPKYLADAVGIDLIEYFEEMFVPCPPDPSEIHTIVSVQVYPLPEKMRLV